MQFTRTLDFQDLDAVCKLLSYDPTIIVRHGAFGADLLVNYDAISSGKFENRTIIQIDACAIVSLSIEVRKSEE